MAELARAVDIVEVAVAPQPALEAVALGTNGLVESARSGTILDIHSTATPEIFRTIAQAGLRETFTLLHQGDDPEHNVATALQEFLHELEAWMQKGE